MERKFALIDISEVTAWTQQQSGETDLKCAVVIEQGEIIGTLRRELNYLVSGVDVDMLIDKSFLIMQETATWPTVMRRMNAENANVIIVIRHRSQAKPENIVGIITRLEVFKSSQEVAKLLGES